LGDGLINFFQSGNFGGFASQQSDKAVQAACGPCGVQHAFAAGQQVQLNLVAGPDARVLQHLFAESDLSSGSDGELGHGNILVVGTSVMMNCIISANGYAARASGAALGLAALPLQSHPMPLAELTALLLLCTASSFSPGPNTALSTALAANMGLKHAMRFVCAVPVGWGLLLTLCAAGLGAVVVAVPGLRFAIQALGVAYMLWLAYKLLGARALAQADMARLQVTFTQGVALQFLNIKAWMLALTVVAGWLAGRDDALQRFAICLPLMVAFGFCSNLLYAAMGSLLRGWLSGPVVDGVATAQRLRWFNRLMAVVLAATAVWMATL
jgi:threonine/homoserine/homoserine lactone efflux protein